MVLGANSPRSESRRPEESAPLTADTTALPTLADEAAAEVATSSSTLLGCRRSSDGCVCGGGGGVWDGPSERALRLPATEGEKDEAAENGAAPNGALPMPSPPPPLLLPGPAAWP